jgi:hypothetical protein
VRVSSIGFNTCCLIQAKTDIQSFRFNFSLGARRLVKLHFIRAEHSCPSGSAPEGVLLGSMQGAHSGRLIFLQSLNFSIGIHFSRRNPLDDKMNPLWLMKNARKAF